MKRNVETEPKSREDRLDSWKEIASYLKQSPRTVQRWERQLGLPVYRQEGKIRGTVFAYTSELEEWFKLNQQTQNRPGEKRLALPILALLALVSVVSLVFVLAVRDRQRGEGAISLKQVALLRAGTVRVSPDGEFLAYRDARRGFLWLRELGATLPDRLLVPHPVGREFLWGTDSQSVVYSRVAPGISELNRIQLSGDGESLWQGATEGLPIPVGESPQGELICRIGSQDPGWDQLIELGDSGVGRPVGQIPAASSWAALSPDGRQVAYSLGPIERLDIYLASLPRGEQRRLTNSSYADIHPAWSADGRYLFMVRGWDTQANRSLMALDLWQEPPTEYRIGPAGDFDVEGGLSISMGGNLYLGHRAETAKAALVEWEAEKGTPTGRVRLDFPDKSWGGSWSDGKFVFSNLVITDTAATGEVIQMRVDLDTGASEFFTPPNHAFKSRLPGNLDRVVARPHQKWGLAHEPAGGELFRFDQKTLELVPLAGFPGEIRGMEPSHRGNQVLVSIPSPAGRGWTVFNVSMVTGEKRFLFTSRLKPFPRWSPDDSEIAYSDANCLMVISSDAQQLQELACALLPETLPSEEVSPVLEEAILWGVQMNPSWSPDGKWLAWSVPLPDSERIEMWAVNRESREHLVLSAGESGYRTAPRGPEWSPDGHWIGFTLETHPPTEVWAHGNVISLLEQGFFSRENP